MDAYEVAKRLRADDFGDAVIIAVSGYGEEAARKRALSGGFDHHLVKPVDYDQLVALIWRAHWREGFTARLRKLRGDGSRIRPSPGRPRGIRQARCSHPKGALKEETG